ncbi:ImmA/IrrE family metallo-endopeptidase [Amycolatopsis sp. NBC_00355]|uniref:ImmA/IrrE family metallo-endopeptidase n=1 Tax=Amycolatopsis sp. NBC_00355 TaxID=2975957 RepID=UPI002E26447F
MINPDIEQRAQDLLAYYNASTIPVLVEAIARAAGIQVVRSPAAGQESGFLMRDGQRVLIGLNSNDSPRRQRFTIAHELGHFTLHEGRPLIVDHTVRFNKRDDVSSAATHPEEIQANAFAAALLMPEPSVYSAVRRHVNSGVATQMHLTELLADEFDVSEQAMTWRLVNLGIYS